ncbi:MAG: hypothetical protein VKJ25_11905 [Okeania sp.]|nr:hypothetical protein [Okeania sp.]
MTFYSSKEINLVKRKTFPKVNKLPAEINSTSSNSETTGQICDGSALFASTTITPVKAIAFHNFSLISPFHPLKHPKNFSRNLGIAFHLNF